MKEIEQDLQQVVGKDWVITKREQMESYLVDETAPFVRPRPAADVVLVKPLNSQEVSAIIKIANDKRIPVFPRGGGTGLVGGAIPTRNGIILSTERMDEIEIDKENLMAVVGAGATLEKLLGKVEDAGLSFPLHPGSEGAFIGGLVACNAGGARAVKHGIARNYVKGIEVVFPTGEIVNLGGKLLKDNAGYNLMHLMIGSEGTLGVITKVVFRLHPKSGSVATLIVPYENRHDAINTVPKILQSDSVPLAIEYVEKYTIEKSAEHLNKKWPCKDGNAFLIIMLEGASIEEIYSEGEKIVETCQKNNSLEPLIAESREERDRILDIRSNIYTSLKNETADILDVAVPPANMGKLLDAIDGIAEKFGSQIPAYGHAGDGNLHPHVMMESDPENIKRMKSEIYRAATDLGGTITGEHGTGKIRVSDLSLYLSEKENQLMAGIKKLFDPNNILNPLD